MLYRHGRKAFRYRVSPEFPPLQTLASFMRAAREVLRYGRLRRPLLLLFHRGGGAVGVPGKDAELKAFQVAFRIPA